MSRISRGQGGRQWVPTGATGDNKGSQEGHKGASEGSQGVKGNFRRVEGVNTVDSTGTFNGSLGDLQGRTGNLGESKEDV